MKYEINLEEVLDNLPIITHVKSEDGAINIFNKQWDKVIGSTDEDWLHLIHPNDLKRVLKERDKSRQLKTPYSIEVRLFSHHYNKYRWFIARSTPILDSKNEIEGWVSVCTDINEVKELYNTSTLNQVRTVETTEKEIRSLEEKIAKYEL